MFAGLHDVRGPTGSGGEPVALAGRPRQATAARATAQTVVDAWRPWRRPVAVTAGDDGWTEPELGASLAKLGDLSEVPYETPKLRNSLSWVLGPSLERVALAEIDASPLTP